MSPVAFWSPKLHGIIRAGQQTLSVELLRATHSLHCASVAALKSNVGSHRADDCVDHWRVRVVTFLCMKQSGGAQLRSALVFLRQFLISSVVPCALLAPSEPGWQLR